MGFRTQKSDRNSRKVLQKLCQPQKSRSQLNCHILRQKLSQDHKCIRPTCKRKLISWQGARTGTSWYKPLWWYCFVSVVCPKEVLSLRSRASSTVTTTTAAAPQITIIAKPCKSSPRTLLSTTIPPLAHRLALVALEAPLLISIRSPAMGDLCISS